MNREEELSLCPFCDGEPYVVSGGPGNTYVKCTECNASTDDGSEERAVRLWNRRALLPTPNTEAEAEPVAWMLNGNATADENAVRFGRELGAVYTPLYAHPPKPEPVGWETDAEWDLEMRCANITEATPFAEVSKLINDLWQQYCLAAEPKPEAEGSVLDKPAMVGGTIFRTGVKASVVIGAAQRLYEKYWESSLAALTAKQTDGRDG